MREKTLISRLRDLREEADLTQTQVAADSAHVPDRLFQV